MFSPLSGAADEIFIGPVPEIHENGRSVSGFRLFAGKYRPAWFLACGLLTVFN